MDKNRTRYVAKVLVLAAVYYGSAKLGLSLAFAAPSVTAVWPPTGIALAALLLWGYRFWPGVALGAFLANAWTGVPIYTVFGITIGNTLEALAGAFLLQQVAGFRPSLDRVRDLIALVGLAAGLSTVISATIGVSSLLLGNEINAADFGSTWRTWWFGDMGGDLVVAPAVLVAVTQWPFDRAPGRAWEAVAVVATVLASTIFVFTQSASLTFLIFPGLIWAAFRFWQPGAVGATLLISAVAVVMTQDGNGPFSMQGADERLVLAQIFVGVAGITGLVLATLIAERRRAQDTVEYIADTLQQSLLPSHLPDIPGVETALDFRPAGERHVVGGDFYDWFEADDGSWAVVVGDVRGTGPRAAAATGLARYTLRAAAVNERSPSRILGLLNEAIRRQSPGESCSVAYLRLEPGNGRGTRATIALGGQPLPLVVRSGGRVESVGSYGTRLGILADPELTELSTELRPGDALVLYTDGLTDAHAPAVLMTEADIAGMLEGSQGRGASEIASGLSAEVVEGGEDSPRDDMLLLVLRVVDR